MKTLILHATWLVVAAAAFLFGRSGIDSNPTGEDDPSEAGSRRSTSKSSGNFSRVNSTGSSKYRSAGGERRGRSGTTVDEFLTENDPLIANKLFADLILGMDASNARSIFEALRERRNTTSSNQMTLFLRAWGQLDGAAAMEAVNDMGRDPRRRAEAGVAAITGWASMDAEGAKAHLAGLDSRLERGVLAQGIVNGLANTDPDGATEFVLELEKSQREEIKDGGREEGRRQWMERGRAYAYDRQLDTIANAQIERGMGAATSWAEKLPDGAIKSSAFDRVAERYAKENPSAAAEWVKSHAENNYAERAVREVAEELSRENPEDAVRWLIDLPRETQSRAIHQSMERWTREDPVAAGNFLRGMDPSESRDAAVRSYANEVDGTDPGTAAEWAGSIANEEIRTEALNGVARSWMRQNPAEAREWLPDSGLSAEQQERVIREADRRDQFRDRFRGRGSDRGEREPDQ